MKTRFDEIADGIYRISTWIEEVAPPAGFTFNQFLVDADEPLLFHAGHRQMFPLMAEQVARVVPVERVRWITFGHVEADECGAMNEWLAAAPQAQIAHHEAGCELSLNDMADRPPVAMADGQVLDLGGKRVRFIYTPHVPHNWEAQVLHEETTGTLFCGDLFAHVGGVEPLTETDIVEPAVETEEAFMGSSLSALSGATIRRLADLEPVTLALMHGASYAGSPRDALHDLAGIYDQRVREALERGLPAEAPGAGCPSL
jgi:flavorubredoxin